MNSLSNQLSVWIPAEEEFQYSAKERVKRIIRFKCAMGVLEAGGHMKGIVSPGCFVFMWESEVPRRSQEQIVGRLSDSCFPGEAESGVWRLSSFNLENESKRWDHSGGRGWWGGPSGGLIHRRVQRLGFDKTYFSVWILRGIAPSKTLVAAYLRLGEIPGMGGSQDLII